MAKICHKKIAALPWVEIRNLLKLVYKKKIQLSRGLKGAIPPHGTNRRFGSEIPSLPAPQGQVLKIQSFSKKGIL
jgi:hypothetical protein